MFRPLARVTALLIALTFGLAGPVAAQAPAQPGTPAPNVSFGQKTYYFEIFLVVALFGGALYAVCRSSNRQ